MCAAHSPREVEGIVHARSVHAPPLNHEADLGEPHSGLGYSKLSRDVSSPQMWLTSATSCCRTRPDHDHPDSHSGDVLFSDAPTWSNADAHMRCQTMVGLLVLMCLVIFAVAGLFLRPSEKEVGANRYGSPHRDSYATVREPHARASMGEAEACQEPFPLSSCESVLQPEPRVGTVRPGRRVRMRSFRGMEYQLFLPAKWDPTGVELYPTVVFLHGQFDGKFSVMNSQSLPRLLASNQSTCFDSRDCWCLASKHRKIGVMREADSDSKRAYIDDTVELESPLADCDFAENFGAIVVMPQGWVKFDGGWTDERLNQVESLTRHVLRVFGGDPARVSLTGQSAGGSGVWTLAATRPELWASVSAIGAPPESPLLLATRLEGMPIWVVGCPADGDAGNDAFIIELKHRAKGSVRYTRYTQAPPPPDPKYHKMHNAASYDLIFRDPRFWLWALSQKNAAAADQWGL